MSDKYLEPTDPGAFDDFPPVSIPKGLVICPKCQGHGGWNLRLNAYSLHGYPDTRENRHRYSHFRASCSSCWGYGYLQPGQTCVHEWDYYRTIGRCLHEWKCVKCGAIREVDSSD